MTAKWCFALILGRPRGKVDESLRLAPVGERLAALLGRPVTPLNDCIGPGVSAAVAKMAPGDVCLLENLRFHAGEESNDEDFSKQLADLADCFVMDAFAVAHRAHASTVGVPRLLPTAMGLLTQREVESLGVALENPVRPLAALMGGAKVSDKILVLENLLTRLDHLFIGGGMAVTFLAAQGQPDRRIFRRNRPPGLRPRRDEPGRCCRSCRTFASRPGRSQ